MLSPNLKLSYGVVDTMHQPDSILHLSGENIIEYIREYRNDIIDKLLNDEELKTYLLQSHGASDVSSIKAEFIKRALKELKATPLDLSHYSHAILEMRKAGSIMVSNSHEKLFYLDIEKSIANYLL